MKNRFKMIGIIALVAVIGFGFTSCGDDNGNGNGNSNGAKTVTFALDKTGNNSFTITIAGADWDKTWAVEYAGEDDAAAYMGISLVEVNGNFASHNSYNGSITGKVITMTKKEGDMEVGTTITILSDVNLDSAAVGNTNGGIGTNQGGTTTYKAVDGKESITW